MVKIGIRSKIKRKFKRQISAGENSKISKKAIIRTAITLEDNVLVLGGTNIGGEEPISIGRYSGIMDNVEIVGPVEIGRYCAVARNVLFQGRDHFGNYANLQTRFYKQLIGTKLGFVNKGGIKVGNAVWIGTRAIILPGVKIGDGAIIGAGSVVTKDVEPFSITAGNPAVHKKYRFPSENIEQLLEIKWWDWPLEKIKKNKDFFTMDLTKPQDLKKIIVD